ncbi:MAG: hypothetical protein ACYC63_16895 [Armatimonadota bacterium]
MGNFLSTLVHGAVGFFTGGPIGAALAVASDLTAPGAPKQQPGVPAPIRGVTDVNAQAAGQDAFLQAYLAGRGGAPSTIYDAGQALGAPLQQRSNQVGGQSSVPGGDGGPFGREVKGVGAGRGGGEKGIDWRNQINGTLRQPAAAATPAPPTVAGQNSEWRQALSQNMAANQGRFTNGLQAGFGIYMNNALAGASGLPREAYDAAQAQGMHTINAQAMQSDRQLQESMGARGLIHSGMMGNALLGVEQSRLGSVGQLQTGLAQQDLQARREAQQNAASMFPSLIGADTAASSDSWHGMLAGRQLELEAQRIGISQQQIDDARRSGNYSILADLVSAGTQLYAATRPQPTTTQNPYYNPAYTPNPYATYGDGGFI